MLLTLIDKGSLMTVYPFETRVHARRVKKPRSNPAPDRLPVSATIITCNEQDRIAACIASVSSLVDQIVVVDSGSQDLTREIAASLGADVHTAPWKGYGPQKRLAEDFCNYDWILYIDADEQLSAELSANIRQIFSGGTPSGDAYSLSIVDKFPHEDVPAPWAFAYRRIRLYDRRKGRFVPSLVHDDVLMDEETTVHTLNGMLTHSSIRNLSDSNAKLNRYTDMQVQDMRARGRRLPRWRLLTEFPFAFLKSYFLRLRILYGWWGLIHSVNYAHMRFLRVAKAYEAYALSEKEQEDRRETSLDESPSLRVKEAQ